MAANLFSFVNTFERNEPNVFIVQIAIKIIFNILKNGPYFILVALFISILDKNKFVNKIFKNAAPASLHKCSQVSS